MPGTVVGTYFSHPRNHGRAATVCLGVALGLFFIAGPMDMGWIPDLSGSMSQLQNGQVWRLWTLLLAHKDLEHLGSNLVVLLPFMYALLRHFQRWLIFFLAFLSAGMSDFLTMFRLPPDTQLLGVSGLAYWAAGAWLTLFILIDTTKSLRRRLAYAIFLMSVLLIPHEYSPSVSYSNHLWGLIFGVVSGLFLFLVYRRRIKTAEILYFDPDEELDGGTAA